ncbi:BAT22 [[Candida] subhashii]|uniref:Branched-chain-amino-acid aminotransferase n=1 Tax=[Candida] subhashii TaxID=561895 RepID=A0A8J5QU66_9ASCO|nr:BAT22 [[Candida] subhashii]KAG7666204.1 BAT22 [[Candida] subhashii]
MSAPLDASQLQITKTTKPSTPLPKEQLVFGKSFTDHILEIEWTQESGWGTPTITPYHTFSLDPATCVLHYSFELFEGLKAYRDSEGKIRTFRVNKNMERMNRSAKRAALPTFDGDEFQKLLHKFLQVEERFVPEGFGYSLYLRPTLIGTSIGLGVSAPTKALLYCIASPVGPYFSAGFKPVSLEATDYAVRAWPKGVGSYKLGANYVSCIEPQMEAAKRGHSQNLWLFGEEGYITEVGAMNVFFAFENEDGTKELVTPPLDGMILPGVTRDSALELARTKLDSKVWQVNERSLTIHEVKARADKGQLIEAFGTGTAAIVSPIDEIEYKGETIKVPVAAGTSGELTLQINNWIKDIQYGVEQFKDWSKVAN